MSVRVRRHGADRATVSGCSSPGAPSSEIVVGWCRWDVGSFGGILAAIIDVRSLILGAFECSWNPFDKDSCEIAEPAKALNHVVNDNMFGWGINGTAGLVVGGTASGYAVFNAHSFGLMGTLGAGGEVPGGASVGTGPVLAIGARNPNDLAGGFVYGGASAGEGLVGGPGYLWRKRYARAAGDRHPAIGWCWRKSPMAGDWPWWCE